MDDAFVFCLIRYFRNAMLDNPRLFLFGVVLIHHGFHRIDFLFTYSLKFLSLT